MNLQQRLFTRIGLLAAVLIVTILPTAALVNADNAARPMQTHDFTDVPVAGQEFMEEYINEFYHIGITGGCSISPLMYCPTNPVTRGSMAVFMGRALGYVDMVDDGLSARAYFKQTQTGISKFGMVAQSVDGTGVIGRSTDGAGVAGGSTNAYGVVGISSAYNGMLASGFGSSGVDDFYDIELGGSLGEIYGTNMRLYSDADFSVDLDNDGGSTDDSFMVRSTGDSLLMDVSEDGWTNFFTNVAVNANFGVSGTKSAIVDTVHYGTRLMYAVEATENWFEDFGTAELVDGEAVIQIDAMYAETVNLNEEYHVFTEPIGGWADLYIAEMTATSFTIRSADGSDVKFSYRIVAKRLGFEDMRMEELED